MSESSRWYRQPVVLLFLGLLVLTVLACIGLIVMAIQTDDGLVADDYYKRGNEIGMEIGRDQQAATLGLSAQLMVGEDGMNLRVLLLPLPAQPKPITLRLAHPTRAGRDRLIVLKPEAGGMLLGQLAEPLGRQRWLVQLEDAAADGKHAWRLRAETTLAPGSSTVLRPQVP